MGGGGPAPGDVAVLLSDVRGHPAATPWSRAGSRGSACGLSPGPGAPSERGCLAGVSKPLPLPGAALRGPPPTAPLPPVQMAAPLPPPAKPPLCPPLVHLRQVPVGPGPAPQRPQTCPPHPVGSSPSAAGPPCPPASSTTESLPPASPEPLLPLSPVHASDRGAPFRPPCISVATIGPHPAATTARAADSDCRPGTSRSSHTPRPLALHPTSGDSSHSSRPRARAQPTSKMPGLDAEQVAGNVCCRVHSTSTSPWTNVEDSVVLAARCVEGLGSGPRPDTALFPPLPPRTPAELRCLHMRVQAGQWGGGRAYTGCSP